MKNPDEKIPFDVLLLFLAVNKNSQLVVTPCASHSIPLVCAAAAGAPAAAAAAATAAAAASAAAVAED